MIERVNKRNDAQEKRCRSWTRKYYSRVNERCVKCKICERVLKISYGNSTGNIHRHIRLKHPYIYFDENKPKTSTQDDDSSDAETVKAPEQILIKIIKIDAKDSNGEVRDDDPVESNIEKTVDNEPELDTTGQSVSLEDEESMIIKKCKQKVIGKHTRRCYSWTHKYYRKISDKYNKCKICKIILKKNSLNNGNIHRHMKNKHPDIYYNETNSNATTKERRDELKKPEKSIQQIIYIKELDKIDTNNSDVRNEEALDYNIDNYIPDADETGQSVIPTEDELRVNSPCEDVLVRKRIVERKNWSWTRKYYHRINNERLIKCRICKKILHFNIHRHIKNKHPDIYLKENPTASNQDLSIEGELRIKNLCENTSGTRQPKSIFWNFFEVVEQDRLYKCSFCKKSFVIFPKNVANLKRHIEKMHKKQFEIIMMHGGLETKNLITLAASGAEVPGVSSVEIAFSSLDDKGSGKFRCSRCDAVIECTEEETETVLIEHVQMCQLKPEPLKNESDAEVIKSLEGYFSYKFIPSPRGKQLLMFNGYTFSQNNHAKRMFYCSKKDSNCKCRIKLGCDGRVESIKDYHNHRPPKYAMSVDGTYLKLSS